MAQNEKDQYRSWLKEGVDFESPEFQAQADWLRRKTIDDVNRKMERASVFGMIGLGFISLGVGVGAGIGFVARKQKIPLGGIGVAMKALFYGTALCVGTYSMLYLLTKRLLGVQTIAELSVALKGKIHPRSMALKEKLNPYTKQVGSPVVIEPTEEEMEEFDKFASQLVAQITNSMESKVDRSPTNQ